MQKMALAGTAHIKKIKQCTTEAMLNVYVLN